MGGNSTHPYHLIRRIAAIGPDVRRTAGGGAPESGPDLVALIASERRHRGPGGGDRRQRLGRRVAGS